MKIVVDIPDKEYEEIMFDSKHNPRNLDDYGWLIANGAPLPKGHWIVYKNRPFMPIYECSNCHSKVSVFPTNYCSECGTNLKDEPYEYKEMQNENSN